MLYLSLGINLILIVIVAIMFFSSKRGFNGYINRQLSLLDNIQEEVNNLNKTFTLPYLRGEAGEILLQNLLSNFLPSSQYSFQYQFKSGQRVDAIIKLGDYIIPIDSKFPLQSLENEKKGRKAIEKYASDISEKYINPNEGTLNFGIMYIPSEALYYRYIVEDTTGLSEKLLAMGIVAASPSTLFLLVQTVLYGLKGYNFTKNQKRIMERIEALKLNYVRLQKQYNLCNTHLKNLNSSFTDMDILITKGKETIPGE